MTRDEFYSAVQRYKDNKLEHRAVPAPISGDVDAWKTKYMGFAVAAASKMKIARYAGKMNDAARYEREWQGYMDKLAHSDPGSVSRVNQEIENLSNEKLNEAKQKFETAKHSDDVLAHGGEWKNHKYIRIENGRYIYPEDLKKASDSLKKEAAYATGKAASWSKEVNRVKNDPKHSGTDIEGAAKINARSYRKAATKFNEKAEKIDTAMKNNFDAAVANTVKTNEERKETEAKKDAVRSKDEGSKNAAQAQGDAMQAWKNARAVRAKDEGSKNAAQSEGDAQQKWKEQQAAKKAAEETKAIQQKKNDAYEARDSAARKAALAEGAKETVQRMLEKGSKLFSEQKLKEDTEKFQAEQNAYEANAKGAQRTKDILANQEIQARAAEWNAKPKEERDKEIADYEKQIKSSRSRMRVLAKFESEAEEYAKQHGAEVVMEDHDSQTGYANKISIVKKTPGDGKHEEVLNTFFIKSESYSDDDWINQAKQEGLSEYVEDDWKREKEEWDKRAGFKHSFDLSTKEDYYAAIEEYKRKKV